MSGDEVLRHDPSVPLVSVIVRSIGRPTLGEALDSVARQTYPNIEVLVVDALGRGHPPVGESCGRFPVRVVRTGEPLSRSRAANAGLDAACGEVLGFLDDDDLFLPEHVAVLAAALVSAPGVRAAYAGVEEIAESGEVVGRLDIPYSYARLCVGNIIPINAALFERSLVQDGCRFDEGFDAYEDWDFWLQVGRRCEIAHVDRTTACYRARGGSGVGLSADHSVQNRAREGIYEKWCGLWSESQLEGVMARLDQEIAEHDRMIAELSTRLSDVDAQLAGVLGSLGWRLTRPARSVAHLLRRS